MSLSILQKAALALFAVGPALSAAPIYDRAAIAIAERVADWQIANPAPRWKSTDWHNAAFYAGVIALSEVSSSPRFKAAMVRMGETNAWKLGERPYHADDHAVGQTYADLYSLEHDPRMIGPMRSTFDFILAHQKDDNLLFDKVRNPDFLDRWSWCDSLFMSPPAWAKLSLATGDSRYLDFAASKWWVTSDYLYQSEEHLYFRDSTYKTQRERNGKKVFWSRGNGWVIAGAVRMLQAMPKEYPSRPRFLAQYQEMALAISALQTPDGFWHSSLLDPGSYPMKESSGTGFFCFALAWGLNQGVLDRSRVEPSVRKAWVALQSCVEPSGRLNHVQPVGSTPVIFDEESTEPYGVGAFLLAASEMAKLSQSTDASSKSLTP